MKKLASIFLMIMTSFVGFSQEMDSTKVEDTDTEVFTIVEKMPEFQGGKDGLPMYLFNNLVYPPEAKSKNIQGTVYVNFVVGKDGKVRDVKVIKPAHDLLNNEALRLVNNMPDWAPGVQRGKNVAVSYNLPIGFKLGQEHIYDYENAKKSYKLALGFHKELKFKKAINHYDKALLHNENHIQSYYNKGMCYLKLENFKKACESWEEAKVRGGGAAVEALIKEHCSK